jgi:Spy/CpxP family protein refolding chaperone
MKTKIFAAFIALALMMPLASTPVFSQDKTDKKSDNERFDKKEGRRQFEIPGLTDDQKAKIKDIRTAAMKEMIPLKNELREKEAHLQSVSTGNNVDLNVINKGIDDIGAVKTTIAKKHAAERYNIRQLLTDDQKVFFDSHQPGKNRERHERHEKCDMHE